jgi:urease accessory protein
VPSLDGHLRLEAVRRPDGQTGISEQSVRAPYHLGKPYWDGRVLQVRVVNTTAGILSGDRLEFRASVGTGAALAIVTPSASRAYVMRSGAAECRQTFTVAAGGWCEFAPEPLFPHRDTVYAQATRLELAAGAEAYYVDALAPGRAGSGETWGWKDLRIGLDVAVGGEVVLRERLAGSGADLGRRAGFFGFAEAWFGTVVACSDRLDGDEGFWDRVRALDRDGVRLGATRLWPGGWVVRIVASGSLGLRDALAGLRALCAEKLPHLLSDLRRV